MNSFATKELLLGLASLGLAGSACAQVEIYGLIDTGIAYVNDIGGRSLVSQQGGGTAANRLGFRGREALGDGLDAFVTLEGGFGSDDGSMAQSSATTARLFGRQAFVGVSSKSAGSLAAGRMYDFMFEMNRYGSNRHLGAYYLRPLTAGAFIGSNGSSTDIDMLGGMRVDNAIRYTSPAWGGFSAGALYGLGEQAGSGSRGRTVSLTAQKDFQPFSAQLVYTSRQDALTGGKYGVGAAGLAYAIDEKLSFNALYTRSKWSITGDKVDVYDIGLRYQLSVPLSLGVGYARYAPNHGAHNAILVGKRDQAGLSAQYAFSKRTTVYGLFTYQHAENGKAQFYFLSPSAASQKVQTVVHAGIRHSF